MARKTVEVAFAVAEANKLFLHSHDDHKLGRQAVATFLTTLLDATDQYNGFGYLNAETMKDSKYGGTPGIIPNYDDPKLHQFPDDSRRFYYPPK